MGSCLRLEGTFVLFGFMSRFQGYELNERRFLFRGLYKDYTDIYQTLLRLSDSQNILESKRSRIYIHDRKARGPVGGSQNTKYMQHDDDNDDDDKDDK